MSLNESRWRKFFGSRIFLAVAFFLAIMAALAYSRAYYQNYQIKKEIARLRDQAEKLKTKKIELFEVLKYVKSDEFVEAKARTELNLTRPGEHVLVIKDQNESPDRQKDESVIGFNNLTNRAKWFRLFLK